MLVKIPIVSKVLRNPIQLLVGAGPRTLSQGSPDEGTGDTVLVFLGALTISIHALTKVGEHHIHLTMKTTIFLLHLDVEENEFAFIAPLAGEVQE